VTELLAIPAMLAAIAIPVLIAIGLLWLSGRRFAGRTGRGDRLFGGVARAGVQVSHVEAATPHVDDIAVPKPKDR
jgi:hypothetical protein